jgi:hypothetical protein
MIMRWLAAGIWLLATALGVWELSERMGNPLHTVVAAHSMRVNHLLRAGDASGLNDSGLIGQYRRLNILPGESITSHDVSPMPLLPVEARPLFAVTTTADAVRAGATEIDASGQICDGADSLAQVEVVAPVCPAVSGAGGHCVVLVRAAPADVAKLIETLGKKPSLNAILFKPSCK